MNVLDLTPYESLWWLFSVAELHGHPPRGCMRLIFPGAPYGTSVLVRCDLRVPPPTRDGEAIVTGLLDLSTHLHLGPTFGVMVARDLWPQLDMPWEERDPWDERPRRFPANPEPFRAPPQPLTYAQVHDSPAWCDVWEGFFGYVFGGVETIRGRRLAGRSP